MQKRQTTPFGLIFLLWCAGLGAAAQFSKVAISLNEVTALYPGAGNTISFVVSVMGIMGIVFGTTAGVLVNRIGYHRGLVAALIFGALMSAYQATLPALPLLITSRIFEGMSHLFIVVAAPTLMAQLSAPRHKSIIMGLWGSFFGIAFALVALFGLPLMEFGGPSALFTGHAVVMAVLAGLIFWLLPKEIGTGAEMQKFSLLTLLDAHRQIYTNPSTALPGLCFLWHTLMYLSLLTYLPTIASVEARVAFSTFMPVAGILGTLASGFITQNLVTPQVGCLAGLLGSTVAMIVLGFVGPEHASFFPLSLLTMVSAGVVAGSVFAMVPAINSSAQNQARANGAIAQMGNVGTSAGTPLYAFTLAGFGFIGLAGLTVGLGILGIAVALIGSHYLRRHTI